MSEHITRSLGGEFLANQIIKSLGADDKRSSFNAAVSNDGTEFLIVVPTRFYQTNVKGLEEIAESIRYSLEMASKIRSGEIKMENGKVVQ